MRRGSWAVVALAVALVGACGGDGDKKTVNASDDDTTTTSSTESTTTTEVPTTIAVTTTAKAKAAEVKEKKCVAGSKQDPQPPPEDWAKTWQTQPDTNQPLTLEICVDDSSPKVGQTVTLWVTADDPDASIGEGQCDIAVDWDGQMAGLCRDALVASETPEPTPAKEHGQRAKTYTHTYTKSGAMNVEVTAWSSNFNGKPHPYDNYSNALLPISVHA